jgi:hypothetical protein
MNATLTRQVTVDKHFPTQLHDMLSQAEAEGYSDVCSWMPHGRAFKVHDREAFVDQVMKRFFNGNKYSSFQRQLNLYGFIRIMKKGKDYGAYYHESFLRGEPELCQQMSRVYSRNPIDRLIQNDPDFYAMEPSVTRQQFTNGIEGAESSSSASHKRNSSSTLSSFNQDGRLDNPTCCVAQKVSKLYAVGNDPCPSSSLLEPNKIAELEQKEQQQPSVPTCGTKRGCMTQHSTPSLPALFSHLKPLEPTSKKRRVSDTESIASTASQLSDEERGDDNESLTMNKDAFVIEGMKIMDIATFVQVLQDLDWALLSRP